MCGDVFRAGELITQVLSQQRQDVFGLRQRSVGAVLLGETAVGGSGLSSTLLMEAAERHVNTEPESDTQRLEIKPNTHYRDTAAAATGPSLSWRTISVTGGGGGGGGISYLTLVHQ